jgi:hypothetical protein
MGLDVHVMEISRVCIRYFSSPTAVAFAYVIVQKNSVTFCALMGTWGDMGIETQRLAMNDRVFMEWLDRF